MSKYSNAIEAENQLYHYMVIPATGKSLEEQAYGTMDEDK